MMAGFPQTVFPLLSRVLHWAMAAMIIVMLFIGIAMVASLSDYHRLVSIHKPLGILVLVFAAIRLINRIVHPPPPLPAAMPGWQRFVAHASHYVLYALMFALPLVGWGMLSAARYPIVLWGPLQLPPILPQDLALFTILRAAHSVLAYLFFATVLAHFAAAMMHALVYRDGVFQSMAGWRRDVKHPAGRPSAAAS
jgi:cytochrome b561